MQIDLNADLGESFGSWTLGDDDAMLDVVTSANVACGFHAGDTRTMQRVVALCAQRGVVVGATRGVVGAVMTMNHHLSPPDDACASASA